LCFRWLFSAAPLSIRQPKNPTAQSFIKTVFAVPPLTMQQRLLPVLLAAMLIIAACSGCSKWISYRAGEDDNKFEVHFIDVGQGDAILVLTPSKTMLVDAGPLDGNAASYISSLGVEEIDIVVATHPHADHIGGMPEIFISFPVREIIDPGVVHTTLTYARYLELIDSLDIPYSEGRKGMRRDLCDDAFAEILHPTDPDEALLNDASVVIRLVLGDIIERHCRRAYRQRGGAGKRAFI
jgi:beta-lactamase superfamily II metal-dependent hydrolase